jgi:hypothetical protein
MCTISTTHICLTFLVSQFLFKSVAITGVANTATSWLGFQYQSGTRCTGQKSASGPACLQTGSANIFGTFWDSPSSAKRRSLAANSTCDFSQNVDVYYLALPGEQRKPYTVDIVHQFDKVGGVNWKTRSFEAEKFDLVQEIISQHGNGLDDAQLAAISAIST